MTGLTTKHLGTFAITCLMLLACSAGPTYLGQAIIEKSFSVDGGKTMKLPITHAGAVPSENERYKIESAGLIASVSKGDPQKSELTWVFSLLAKEADDITAVVVEKVTDTGGLELMVKDQAPMLKNKNWYGKSASKSMIKADCPWLYSSSDETFILNSRFK